MVFRKYSSFNQFVLLILLLTLWTSCSDDGSDSTPDPDMEEMEPGFVVTVDSELQEYIDRFVAEGEARGITTLSLDRLTAIFVDEITQQSGTTMPCGYGWWDYFGTGAQRIEIRDTEGCWSSHTDLEKENFMFHELGHALLSRDHTTKSFSKGQPASIMCGSAEDNCNNFTTYYQTAEMREYYLDEMFNRIIGEPDWVSYSNLSQEFLIDSFDGSLENWGNYTFNDSSNVSGFQFTIDSSGVFESNSLKIEAINEPLPDASGVTYHRFSIGETSGCTTLRISGDVKSVGMSSGTLNAYISLREIDAMGDSTLFFFKKTEIPLGADEELVPLVSELYCIPAKSEVVTLTLQMLPKRPASVFVDNLRLELLE